MPKYMVRLSPSSFFNEEEYIIETESEDTAKYFAVVKYLHDRASSMEFDFEVEEL